jgi:hypothetical protein
MSLGDLKTPLPKRSVKPLPLSLLSACGFLRRFSTFFTEVHANSFRQMRYLQPCGRFSVRFVFAAVLRSFPLFWPMSLLLDF